MATDQFDPYEQWLGISRHERPIDFYRLLGVERFEDDPQRIIAAAEERMAYIRQFQTGPRGLHTQKLLNEFSSAKLKLSNPVTKAEYDERLRHSAQAAEEFATAEDVALPEAVVPDASAPEVPAIPATPFPQPRAHPQSMAPAAPVVPVHIHAKRRAAEVTKQPNRAARIWPLIIAVAIVAAAVWTVGNWYRDRQQDISKHKSDEELVGMQSAAPIAVPEGYIEQRASGQVELPARSATIEGSTATLVNEGDSGVIADWKSGDDYATWKFFLRRGAVFRIKVTYAVEGEPDGARWQVRIDDQEKSWDLRATGGLEAFVTDQQMLIQVQEPGKHRLELRVSQKPSHVILSVQSVVLEPRHRARPEE